jgi:hypothetical protein
MVEGRGGVLVACAKAKKRREKGSGCTGVALPFYTGATVVGGWAGEGRYGGGATHRGFGEGPDAVDGRRRGPATTARERRSRVEAER